jgi:hypothetical protein
MNPERTDNKISCLKLTAGDFILSKNPRLSSKRPLAVQEVLRQTRRVLLGWLAQNV